MEKIQDTSPWLDRSTIKRLTPRFVKRMFDGLRDRLNGPGIEYAVLNDNVFQADASPVPRINLVLPDLSNAAAFGGVMTGLKLFNDLVTTLADYGIEARIVTEKAIKADDNAALAYPALRHCAVHVLSADANRLPTRARDAFIVFNWWVSLNLEPVLRMQAKHFGQHPVPKIQMIQEYEPGFYPFSAAHLLAREAMGGQWPIWAIFNTKELRDFWAAEGHRAEREFIFEPRMNAGLRPYADDLSVAEKENILLVYGRPQVPRNAFYLVHRSLEIWAEKYGRSHTDWRILSAGEQHDDISLAAGHRIRSLGKASLAAYATLLRKTAIGLSLMVSPHPSYPPLEMAHFGVRVLTNAYGRKHLTRRHENLLFLGGVTPQDIAEAIEREIRTFEADPSRGITGRSRMPDYLEKDGIECLADIAEGLTELLLPTDLVKPCVTAA